MYLLSVHLVSVSLAHSSSSIHLLKTYVSKKEKKKKNNVSKDHTLGLHVHEQLDHGEHAVFPFYSEADDPQMCVFHSYLFLQFYCNYLLYLYVKLNMSETEVIFLYHCEPPSSVNGTI